MIEQSATGQLRVENDKNCISTNITQEPQNIAQKYYFVNTNTRRCFEVNVSSSLCGADEKVTIETIRGALKNEGHEDVKHCVVFRSVFDPFHVRIIEDSIGTFYTRVAQCDSAYLVSSDGGKLFVIGKNRVGDNKEFRVIVG